MKGDRGDAGNPVSVHRSTCNLTTSSLLQMGSTAKLHINSGRDTYKH